MVRLGRIFVQVQATLRNGNQGRFILLMPRQAQASRSRNCRRCKCRQLFRRNLLTGQSVFPNPFKEIKKRPLRIIRTAVLLYSYSYKNYSARKVKRLKSTIFNSASASFSTSLTVFLASMISSWFSRQTSFRNLPRRPLAIF